MRTPTSPTAEVTPVGVPADSLMVAVVGRAQGLTGELRLNPTSGEPERLLGLKRLWLVGVGEEVAPRVCDVLRVRVQGNVAVARVSTVTDRTAAEALVHHEVWALRSELPALAENEFGASDVVGARLFRVAGDGGVEATPVGVIEALQTISGNDYFEVATGTGTSLVPLVKDWLVELDLDAGRVLMRLPDGLFDN